MRPAEREVLAIFTNARVVVENLAFDKIVGIWGHSAGSGNWGFFPCSFDHSVPNNSEIWSAHIGSTEIDQFDVEYRVLGNIYWDNNAGSPEPLILTA